MTVFWDTGLCSTALMMGAVRTSETSVYSKTTWCYIPEDRHLHTITLSLAEVRNSN